MGAGLPEFTNPPVSEVALSVQFAPLGNWRGPHAGMYWGRIKEKYPLTESHPLLPLQLETFDDTLRPAPSSFRIEFANPDLQRYWFLTDPPNRIVQVQRDRFVVNWRKVKGDELYPRYESDLRPKFIDEWDSFCAFLRENEVGEPQIQQCDITYVNDSLRETDWPEPGDSVRLFSPWWGKGTDGFLPLPETLNVGGSFLMPDKAGRLYFSVQTVIRSIDSEAALQLQLVARGAPKSGTTHDILAWMDLGHEWIVRGFADLTSPYAHKIWGRKR